MISTSNEPSERHISPLGESVQPVTNPLRRLNSKDILQGEKEVWIVHNQELYRLRETKNGKLILQK